MVWELGWCYFYLFYDKGYIFVVVLVFLICMDVLGLVCEMVVPVSVEMLVWELLAFSSSLLFFKELDYSVQQTEWWRVVEGDQDDLRGILTYRFLRVLLDLSHHWYSGLFLNIYCDMPVLNWVGAGIFVADIPDFIRRVVDMVAYMGQLLSYINGDAE